MDEIDLKDPKEDLEEGKQFGKHEEAAIISLAFDQPEFFSSIQQYIKPEYFERFDTSWVFSILKYHIEKHDVILSRELCLDIALDELTADDPHEEIVALINRRSDPRETPIITEKMAEWSKRRAMMQLYEREVIEAVERGEFEDVNNIMEDVSKITNIGSQCHFFFNEIEPLFQKEMQERFTTGFSTLDMAINEGGPTRGETFCVMAPTGVGKSIFLVNMAVANIKKKRNVLFVSLEMPWKKVALRFMGCFTKKWIKKRFVEADYIKKELAKIKNTYGAELVISEFPPDEVTVDTIHAQIDMLWKMHGLKIDVVIIDYLELLMSRNPAYNKDDYIRQKRVGTEVDRIAKMDNTLVGTATQSNRQGTEGADKEKLLDLNKVAESYGKTMPISYLVTINQTKQEYDAGREGGDDAPVLKAQCRFYIAKNRNGPKFKTINARINYETMAMTEYESLTSQTEDKDADSTE
jgi:replicative DNA helicase